MVPLMGMTLMNSLADHPPTNRTHERTHRADKLRDRVLLIAGHTLASVTRSSGAIK